MMCLIIVHHHCTRDTIGAKSVTTFADNHWLICHANQMINSMSLSQRGIPNIS